MIPSFIEREIKGTPLARSVRRLKLGRLHVTERLVKPIVVEPADVLDDDGELELGPTLKDAVFLISSVFSESTNESAIALSWASPTEPTTPWSVSPWVESVEG